jgi:hypothetical protein
MSRLQQFGITFGYQRVVIYIQPNPDVRLMTNTARTSLLISNEPLPWAEWAAEFRQKLPGELKHFVELRAPEAINTDYIKSIRDRLKSIIDLYKVSRYRSAVDGSFKIDPHATARGGKPATTGLIRPTDGVAVVREQRTAGGREGNLYALFERKDGSPGEKVEPDIFPKIDWVSVQDGSRAPGDMEDRAAKYLSDQNRLLINADFRVFRDLISHFMRSYNGIAAAETIVKEAVHGWFAQALVEAVIGIEALRNSKQWSAADIQTALSEEALTSCVMQRYHIHLAAKRELGSKIGSAKQAAA